MTKGNFENNKKVSISAQAYLAKGWGFVTTLNNHKVKSTSLLS